MNQMDEAPSLCTDIAAVWPTWALLGSTALTLFLAIHWALGALGADVRLTTMVAGWYLVGLISALYWPLRWWRNMHGHWRGYLPEAALLALFGPLALAMAYPF